VAGTFPTGVTVLSTVAGGQPYGMTVNAFTSLSLEPLLVLAAVNNASRTYHRVRASGVFAVTVLGADQSALARWFADPNRPAGLASFAEVAWRPGPGTGSPVLMGGLSYFDCAVERVDRAGDHTLLIGRVRDFDVLSARPPLLFFHGRFADPAGAAAAASASTSTSTSTEAAVTQAGPPRPG
jgi:flavin reductase (DIM6/NTAB) family NADH-FMN oxidoreductase RutF